MKNYSKSDLQIANKKLTIIIALMLTIVITVSVILGVGFGVYGSDASKWFKTNDTTGNQQDSQIIITPDPETSSLMTLSLGAVTVAENGMTTQSVTATMAANVAEQNKAVSWSVAWSDPSSTWAKGKTVTDYVTVDPTSAGAHTATLTNTQAFGEPIVLKVQSVSVPGVLATAQIDYVKRLGQHRIDINGTDANSDYTLKFGADDVVNYNTISIVDPDFGTGTLTPEITITSVDIKADYQSGAWDGVMSWAFMNGHSLEETDEIFYKNMTFAVDENGFKMNIRDLFNKDYPFQDFEYDTGEIYNWIYQNMGNTEAGFICDAEGGYLTVNYTLTVAGKVIECSEDVRPTNTYHGYIVAELVGFNVNPTKIELDHSQIIF